MTSWTPPSELLAPPPRKVKMTWSFRFLIFFPSVMYLLVFGTADIQAYRQAQTHEILKQHGISRRATITSAEPCKNSICVNYRYDAPDPGGGNVREFEGSGRLFGLGRVDIGSEVNILFDPVQPSRSALNPNNEIHQKNTFTDFDIWMKISLVTLLVLVLPVAAFYWWCYTRVRYLLCHGQIAVETIVDQKDYKTKSGTYTHVTYRFTDLAGNTIEGSRRGIPALLGQTPKLREQRARYLDNPTVVYDPAKSSRNVLYPLDSVKLA